MSLPRRRCPNGGCPDGKKTGASRNDFFIFFKTTKQINIYQNARETKWKGGNKKRMRDNTIYHHHSIRRRQRARLLLLIFSRSVAAAGPGIFFFLPSEPFFSFLVFPVSSWIWRRNAVPAHLYIYIPHTTCDHPHNDLIQQCAGGGCCRRCRSPSALQKPGPFASAKAESKCVCEEAI